MDFYQIKERSNKGIIEIYPDFKVTRSKDLMVRGKSFYAIWDEEKGLWSTDEYDVQRMVDNDLMNYRNKLVEKKNEVIHVKFMSDFSTNAWTQFKNYLSRISDNSHQLDEHLTFQNSVVKKTDYVSRRLPYSLVDDKCDAYDQLMQTLYSPEERQKLEWAIGAIVAGEAKDIQKFIVLYGEGGSGKSTFLNIVQKLFAGYYTTFEAKALTTASNTFSTEVFRANPLVAIQHDGDLSRIEDNTKLNSIVSHEEMVINEKYKPAYTARANCFLFLATNKPVKISDAKSGIIRRLIDVKPSGKKIPIIKYFSLMSQIDFELGAIASKCLKVYRSMGKNYYSTYRPLGMIFETDVFFNYVENYYYLFIEQKGVSLSQAYSLYKEYCEEANISNKLPKYKFRDELKNYFNNFYEVKRIDGKLLRNYFSDLKLEKFTFSEKIIPEDPSWIVLEQIPSIFDEVGANWPAQYANESGIPTNKWKDVKTTLKDLDTSKTHYIQLPSNHIVIDFDIKDHLGNKSSELNLEAASKWPPTYVEYSKSQAGLHLHYIYEGDTRKLNNFYAEGIEIKTATIRRKLSKCNNIPIASISSGLPFKKEKPKMINFEVVKSEKALRELIQRNLNKEIHPYTKPSVDFIYKILEEAYKSGLAYDVRDMQNKILTFAMKSSNNADYCVRLVSKMHFSSEDLSINPTNYLDDRIVFFDVEVFPNLFLVCWKYEGKDKKCIHMINPSAQDIEELLKFKLIGFNCRRYDNHILYARFLGYSIPELFKLSVDIISNRKKAFFNEAYNISYTDVYDFSSVKQSLKKFQIELGIYHNELGIPFDKEIPEDKWPEVIEYCDNDVISTEAVFNYRKQDFIARQILADLSGLSVNDTTQAHTSKIIFGDDKHPQDKFVYTDLSELFPGYVFDSGKSFYQREEPGEGGYVYAEPGFYKNVVVLDVASMHPTSIVVLNLFGEYTDRYRELIEVRLAIKHKDFNKARKAFNGLLEKYLNSPEDAADLSYALKIIINIVYGLTSASFDNKFRDPRNVDNIVAKRGALFMIDLKLAVQEEGFQVVHIKTDSIKIPNPSQEIVDFIIDFGKKYGYTFEQEGIYEKFLLVNDSVYIAKDTFGKWIAVGAEFQHPYIFKTLFTKSPITFADLCEVKSVTTALYLNMNSIEEPNYIFVGRTGSFVPVKTGGGLLLREKDGKYYAVTGTKGYRWMESETVKALGMEDNIDLNYYNELVDKAIDHINQYVNFEEFIEGESYEKR